MAQNITHSNKASTHSASEKRSRVQSQEPELALQACSFASGIDTGCCHGDQLTALVLPTLAELEARNWVPPKEGVTRENLGAELVSLQAWQKYAKD